MGQLVIGFAFQSRIGIFRILAGPNGWGLWLDDLHFDGPFGMPQQALDELAGGHCYWPTSVDTSTLGLPTDIGDWTPLRRR